MSRAEQRRKAKETKKKKATYNMTTEQIRDMKRDAQDAAIVDAFTLLLGIPVKILSRYGWTFEDLTEFAEDVEKEYQEFNEGEMTIEEYKQMVWEKCGVKFEKN